MTAVRWLLAIPAALLFAVCILGNWSMIIGGMMSLAQGREAGSFSLVLPFIGPIFGVIFLLAVPVEGFARWWWLAMLIEPTWLLGAGLLFTRPFVKDSGTPE